MIRLITEIIERKGKRKHRVEDKEDDVEERRELLARLRAIEVSMPAIAATKPILMDRPNKHIDELSD